MLGVGQLGGLSAAANVLVVTIHPCSGSHGGCRASYRTGCRSGLQDGDRESDVNKQHFEGEQALADHGQGRFGPNQLQSLKPAYAASSNPARLHQQGSASVGLCNMSDVHLGLSSSDF